MIAVDKMKFMFDYSLPEINSIKRCLETLYAVRAGSQPLDREFGIDWGFVDKPLPVAKLEFAFEVITKTKKYEPRVKVVDVEYEFDESRGIMIPVIHLTKGGTDENIGQLSGY